MSHTPAYNALLQLEWAVMVSVSLNERPDNIRIKLFTVIKQLENIIRGKMTAEAV